MSEAWRLAESQYEYFSNEDNGYINGEVIRITSQKEIKEVMEKYEIQKGDLMYF